MRYRMPFGLLYNIVICVMRKMQSEFQPISDSREEYLYASPTTQLDPYLFLMLGTWRFKGRGVLINVNL
jgi:hypothetical protein